MLKKYVAAWIAVVAFVVVGLVSFAEAPGTFDVYDNMSSLGFDVAYRTHDEDLGDIPTSGIPTVAVFENRNGWNATYNYGDYVVLYTAKTEMQAFKYLTAGVAISAPEDWDGWLIVIFYEPSGTNGHIANIVDLLDFIKTQEAA